ncbi:pentapeptide repeat-containing protein [Oscillatoria sp. FACHB-1406]|nr:pentapeptide repeat-containing protein [Oscillatoria sp. FACHB-1406]MBD2576138.1 pentapeptide repeat-containing protein [Oscillatoria sp. FACHB-1406]
MSFNIRQWLVDRQIDLDNLLSPGVEVSGVAFRALQEMELKSLTPFDICSVADVLELPLRASVRVAKPIAQLTVSLLRLASRKKTLKRSEGTWLTFQIAYLNALQEILEQEARLRRPWIHRANVPVGEETARPFSDPYLQGLLQTLRPGRLSDSQAEQALVEVGDSLLVQQMNKLTIGWLVTNGAEETEAQLIAQRLTDGLPGHLLAVIAENAIPLAQLQKFVGLGIPLVGDGDPESELPDWTIDLERERYRAQLMRMLSEPMFGATFSLQDLYVPLKGVPVLVDAALSWEGEASEENRIDLYEWAIAQLQDTQSLAAIEAESGGGKSSFCQIFASRIARERYPEWMPIVIRLGEVELGETLEQTLESLLPQGRFSEADGWLSPQSPPLLLILDGLDELPPSPYKLRHHHTLVDQVMQFHAQCLSSQPPLKHKILLTGSPNFFEGLSRRYRVGSFFPLQAQLQRLSIQPMDRGALQQWFVQWSKLQSKQISHRYFTFLRSLGLFGKRFPNSQLARLVHQPLMLYLLGILHRDGLLDGELFEMSLPQFKFEVYERLTRWLLGESRGRKFLPEGVREGMAHANRGADAIASLLAGRPLREARESIQQFALTLWHTGAWKIDSDGTEDKAKLTTLPSLGLPLPPMFFSRSTPPSAEYRDGIWSAERSYSSSGIWDHRFLVPQGPSRITFSHLSLGTSLAAGAIARNLQALVRSKRDRYGEVAFEVASALDVARHLYELLGYGLLSMELEELLVESLCREEKRSKEFSLIGLCDRLERFYRSHCQGRWVDEGIAHEAYGRLQALGNSLNVLQIDAAVGLNVFLLLCSLSRATSVPFWPCGNPNQPQGFDADRFASAIARSAVLSPTCFFERARQGLSQLQLVGARLHRIMLPQSNFAGANLSIAELYRANLVSANLSGANLSWASLAGADLHNCNLARANLEGANLSQVNLLGANLDRANLANACLFGAKLEEEQRQLARQQGAFFSWDAFQEYSQSLANNFRNGDLLDSGAANFLEMDSTLHIQVAEGEPVLPSEWETQPWEKVESENVQHARPSKIDPDAATLAEDALVAKIGNSIAEAPTVAVEDDWNPDAQTIVDG